MKLARPAPGQDFAAFYLARGADAAFAEKIARFAQSYRAHPAGLPHDLFVIFKGFRNAGHLDQAREALAGVPYTPVLLPDEGLDLGAYFRAAIRVGHHFVTFFNTSSVINGDLWLWKLWRNLSRPGVGIVGATGTFEGEVAGPLAFPNIHLRTNGFMMVRSEFLASRKGNPLRTKEDAYALEHGEDSITAQCLKAGRIPLVVGKDGRGFEPLLWPVSNTFRQGKQENLLVRDGQTDAFDIAPHAFKRALFSLAWGDGEPIEAFRLWNEAPPAARRRGARA